MLGSTAASGSIPGLAVMGENRIGMVRTLRIGIASREAQKARMLAIARGERKPTGDEPKVWFTSIESVAQVLSDKNRMLLELIAHCRVELLAARLRASATAIEGDDG